MQRTAPFSINHDSIERVKSPILIYQGDDDTILPYALGKKLYAAARSPKVMLTIPGGHHTLPFENVPWEAIKPFVEQVASVR